MKIIATETHIEIIELDDFNNFHVEAYGDVNQVIEHFIQVKAGLVINQEYAELSLDFIKQQAGHKLQDAHWMSSLNHMLDYALNKGWFNPVQQAIRAHIEWMTLQKSEV